MEKFNLNWPFPHLGFAHPDMVMLLFPMQPKSQKIEIKFLKIQCGVGVLLYV